MAKRAHKKGFDNRDSHRTEKVYTYLKQYLVTHAYPPSLPDICADLISQTTARNHLTRLKREGKIERAFRTSRGIRLKPE